LQPLSDPLPGARLYRVTDSLPRVFLAGHAEVVPDEVALSRLYEPAVVAGESAWLASDANARSLLAPPGRAGTCQMDFFGNRRLQAHCDAEQPGLAVFNEQYDQGWSAMVDGQPAPVLRANLNMRALALAPGAHRIVMEYSPPGLWARCGPHTLVSGWPCWVWPLRAGAEGAHDGGAIAGGGQFDKSSSGHYTARRGLLLVTVAILCVVYFPIWLGRIVFTSDVAHWMFPARWFVRESLLRGELPGWNPFQGIGFPIFANPLYGVFYPPNWLALVVPPTGWPVF
jgi:hypothetical protein